MDIKSFKPGSLIAGRFEIVQEIGHGATSAVYDAIDKKLNRRVALKLIPKNETLEERVKREIQITAKLNHPNIVTLHDFLVSKDFYIVVMEFVEGVSLRKMLEKRKKIPWDKAVYIIYQVASALEEAHKNSVVHKDIKPENILISKDGKVKLADFGISSLITRRKEGTVSGTLGYMSPEQISGKYVDETSDIYALGVVFYEMLTGTNPFVSESLKEGINRTFNLIPEEPSKIEPSVPAKISEIVMKAISKDPDFRFQSATALKKALSDFQQSLVKQAEPERAEKEQVETTKKTKPGFEMLFLKLIYLAAFFAIVFFIAPITQNFKGLVGFFISLAIFVLGFVQPQAANIVAALAVSSIYITKNLQIGLLLLASLMLFVLFNSEHRRSLLSPLPFLESIFSKIGFFPFSSFFLVLFADGTSAFTGGLASAFTGVAVKLYLRPPSFPFFERLSKVKEPGNLLSFIETTILDIQILTEILIIALSIYVANSIRSSISHKAYAKYASLFSFLAILMLGYQIFSSAFNNNFDVSKIFLSAFPGFLTALAVAVIFDGIKKVYERKD